MKEDTEDEENSIERTYNDDEEEEEEEKEEADDGSTKMDEVDNDLEEVKSVNIPKEDETNNSFEEILQELRYDIQNEEDYESLKDDMHSLLFHHMKMDAEQWTQVESSYNNFQEEDKSAFEGLRKRHEEKRDVVGNMVENSLKNVCEQNQKLKKQNKRLWRMYRKQLRNISKLEEKLNKKRMRTSKHSVQPTSATAKPTTKSPSTTELYSSLAVISIVTKVLHTFTVIFSPSIAVFTRSAAFTIVNGTEENTKKTSEEEKRDENQEPNKIVTEIANLYENEFGERHDFSRSGIKKRVKSRTNRKKTELTNSVVGNEKKNKIKYINKGHLVTSMKVSSTSIKVT